MTNEQYTDQSEKLIDLALMAYQWHDFTHLHTDIQETVVGDIVEEYTPVYMYDGTVEKTIDVGTMCRNVDFISDLIDAVYNGVEEVLPERIKCLDYTYEVVIKTHESLLITIKIEIKTKWSEVEND